MNAPPLSEMERHRRPGGIARRARTILRWIRLKRWREGIRTVPREAVLARVRDSEDFTSRYAFMTLMSAGIAILGLLLGSPAVIIGAMLVSPLMGPIVALGFALATFDWPRVRVSATALVGGSALALGFAWLIVMLSPLRDMTSEIAARTRPNLFDLLVALFSGLAGAYATIRGRGDTIVGVAIATALMPPLAVAGFGLATGASDIFFGAFFLYLTNAIVIALAAAMLAKFYGFTGHLSPDQTRTQARLLVGTMVALAIPLTLSLRQIAWETYAAQMVRQAVAETFPPGARIESLEPYYSADPVTFHVTVISDQFIDEAEEDVRARLARSLNRDVAVRLGQLLVNQDLAGIERDRAAIERRRQEALLASAQRMEVQSLALAAGVGESRVLYDPGARTIRIDGGAQRPFQELMALETELRASRPGWRVLIIPALVELPAIAFAEGSASLDEGAATLVDSIGWAMARWSLAGARVGGSAASGEPPGIAAARALAVRDRLAQSGVMASVEVIPLSPSLRQSLERERGREATRIARISPRLPPAALPLPAPVRDPPWPGDGSDRDEAA